MEKLQAIINKLTTEHDASDEELLLLIGSEDENVQARLATEADKVRRSYYGADVYIRGLIEFTNYCKNNCYYCGIRAGNKQVQRYRLTQEQILSCCREGYALGFRTFVLQGGEDPYFTDDKMCSIIEAIRVQYPDCAITLSIGEKERASYQAYFDAGANRFLLRHETACREHYAQLHPASMDFDRRLRCLWNLKEIGYQVGSGFMVGSPWQRPEHLLQDVRFLQRLQPDMIGIGPYITHAQTPFAHFASGSLNQSLRLLSLLRLLFPYALLPATTALGTIAPGGRELGLKSGANVVMPNLSPAEVRQLYSLYNNKLSSGSEAAQGLAQLKESVSRAGYKIVTARGDVRRIE